MAVTILRRFYKEKDIFDFNLKYLFFVGMWPKENYSRNNVLLYKVYESTLHILSFLFVVITGIGIYTRKLDIIVFLTNFDKTIVGYNFILKVVVFMFKRDEIKTLIDEMVRSGDKMSETRKELMAKLIMIVTAISTVITGTFSVLGQLKGEMIIEAWMPFDPMKNRMTLALAAQIVVITFVPCLYRALAMQGIVYSMIMYLCDQLIELQDKLKRLKYSKECEADVREEFKWIIQKHIRLMRYSNSMEDIFKEYFLIQNLAVTIELCVNAMMIIVVGFEQKTLLVNIFGYLFIALLNAYIYSYLGNELIIQSEGIAVAAYESAWTSWPVDMQKNIQIVIMVAQKPLKLSAAGITLVSLRNYGQALYNGYSIFAVLNDVIN